MFGVMWHTKRVSGFERGISEARHRSKGHQVPPRRRKVAIRWGFNYDLQKTRRSGCWHWTIYLGGNRWLRGCSPFR